MLLRMNARSNTLILTQHAFPNQRIRYISCRPYCYLYQNSTARYNLERKLTHYAHRHPIPPWLLHRQYQYIQSFSSYIPQTPIVIIGGGPTGLLLSILLSQYATPHVLLECNAREGMSHHPKAHYLNIRTMEIIKHCLSPEVYQMIVDIMPPPNEWKGFTFSHSILGRRIARVDHPIDDMTVRTDGRGRLIEESSSSSLEEDDSSEHHSTSEKYESISNCIPGHLSQNILTNLLLQEAHRAANSVNDVYICHGLNVTDVSSNDDSEYLLTVSTNGGKGPTFETRYAVAADGASSQTRDRCHTIITSPIPYKQPKTMIQHIISIYFRTSPKLTFQLKQNSASIGMLHFVYNEYVVAVFICYDVSKGEWVMQIPYFPPLQDAAFFTIERVHTMILASFLGHPVISNPTTTMVEIISIKPWIMNQSVATSYLLGPSSRIILAGDAAHEFPPAGGFGMNTGMQDSQDLAWRLALDWKRYNRRTMKRMND